MASDHEGDSNEECDVKEEPSKVGGRRAMRDRKQAVKYHVSDDEESVVISDDDSDF